MDQAARQFWTFSIDFYSKAGVKDALLVLQDTFGLDVNIVLYCCWRWHQCGYAVSLAELQELERAIAPWRSAVTENLRAARRALTEDRSELGLIDGAAVLRGAVLRAEIESERVAQQLLVNTVADNVLSNEAKPGTGDALEHALTRYVAQVRGDGVHPNPDVAQSSIAIIMRALAAAKD